MIPTYHDLDGEPYTYDSDPLAPARGSLLGAVAGTVAWLGLIALVYGFTRWYWDAP